MRGKQPRFIVFMFQRGITPAGAGKTEAERENIESYKDHPRRCGENVNRAVFSGKIIGSPPQVRGKLISADVQTLAARITPAGAGKTRL